MVNPSNSDIISLNKKGWVLYYADFCGFCKDVKENMGPIKWGLMNKVECTGNKCPVDIDGYPTWKNTYTGQHWTGEGVFR